MYTIRGCTLTVYLYSRGPPRVNLLKSVKYSCPTGCSVSPKLLLGEHCDIHSEEVNLLPHKVKKLRKLWMIFTISTIAFVICDYFNVDGQQRFLWSLALFAVSGFDVGWECVAMYAICMCRYYTRPLCTWRLSSSFVRVLFQSSPKGNNWLCWWPYKLALIASNNELECYFLPLIYL